MKKEKIKKNSSLFLFCFLLFIFFTLIIDYASPQSASNGASTGTTSKKTKKAKTNELDNVIRELSDYLNKRIPAKSKVVFLNIKSDWPDFSEYVLSSLAENGVNDGVFTVVDRQQLNDIRSELNFQYSGEVSDASAQRIGQMFGAQSIVSGSITTISSMYRITLRAISVENAELQGQFTQNIDGKVSIVASLTKRIVPASSSQTIITTAPSTTTTPATQATPAVKTYNIGDTGPAGGIIFYDKKNNSGGWRYLEAAPVEAEFQAPWCSESIFINTTTASIGDGKRNTKLILETLSKMTGQWDMAAQRCDELMLNGFDDWFLPSQEELNQMYGNLKRKNLGGFRENKYWSSTSRKAGIWDGVACIDFENGELYSLEIKRDTSVMIHYVRPIRQF